jgi:hypothetical protein
VQPHASDAGELDEALEAAVDVRGVERRALAGAKKLSLFSALAER